MRSLITGGAGFIGSHLAEALVARGEQVIVLDDLSTGRYDNVAPLLERGDVEFALGSILNADLVDDLVRRADRVFHLAAAVGVQLIVEQPLESLATNLRGSENVLEKAHKYDTPTLVTSTSEIYGKNTSDVLGEDDDRILGSPLKTRWSYSEAKAIEEVLAHTYWRQKGLRTVVTRLFNTVGPRQTGHYGMVIPRFVNQALRDEPLTVYGDGTQTRCFTHVADVVRALVDLAEHPDAPGTVFNVGSQDETSIAALAEQVIELSDSNSTVRYVPYDEAYEEGFEDMARRVPDTTRLEKLTGFAPTIDLDGIIRSVVADQRS
ncbi:NAD-dependent epimerase/dehydratase family protein [Egibacter rhizosphaerae]|uniref:NAD-dependent epimerase/dehydratase family protein n=1 Tax=Egibacter rhizosphaerae TaxID=1670831 RepID=A0A411YHY1_9ACTN|nr:NAD-dependent epimerase/dehydratase family protein [Egibacter rhizosphaerae]QBI20827.1 NAD-dependent epimerase/dehydratase family protein [Egibacter rhizosphaerae]